MDRRVFTALLLAAVVFGLGYLVFVVFQPFLLGLLWAAVLAIVTHRPYERLVRLLGGRRTLGAVLMTAGVLLLVVGPFIFLSLAAAREAVQDLEPGKLKEKANELLETPVVQGAIHRIEKLMDEPITPARIAQVAKAAAEPVVAGVANVVGFLANLVIGIAIFLLSIFFLYRDGSAAVRALRGLVPLSDADRDAIFGDIRSAIEASVRGGLLTALAQGALGYVILAILGLESALLLAFAMALASLVPLVGTSLVWLPVAGILALEGQTTDALVLVGYSVVVIGSADNFLRPIFVGQHMTAHPLILFFGTVGGILQFGFAGIVIGPVVVALMNVTARLFRREFSLPSSGSAAPA